MVSSIGRGGSSTNSSSNAGSFGRSRSSNNLLRVNSSRM